MVCDLERALNAPCIEFVTGGVELLKAVNCMVMPGGVDFYEVKKKN